MKPSLEDETIKEILRHAKTIAVVGCSRNPTKDAYQVPWFLQAKGYRIIPINPHAKEILGEKAYKSIHEVPKTQVIDIINIFRPNHELPEIVLEAVKIKPKLIWAQ